MRTSLVRRLDTTPELVIHQQVVNPKAGGLIHWCEDQWVAQQDRETIADYLAYSLRFLNPKRSLCLESQ